MEQGKHLLTIVCFDVNFSFLFYNCNFLMSVWILLFYPFSIIMPDIYQIDMCRYIFCIYLVQLTFQGSSNGFSSSRTSRITFVDLASPENDDLEGAAKNSTKEERHLKKSLSRLGYVNL